VATSPTQHGCRTLKISRVGDFETHGVTINSDNGMARCPQNCCIVGEITVDGPYAAISDAA
jgi:hypothetical protein